MNIDDVLSCDSKPAPNKNGFAEENNRQTKHDVLPETGKDNAFVDLSKDCFSPSAQSRISRLDKFHGQLDERLSRLFDGDRPLEISHKAADSRAQQKWLVVMNMAVDFGGECTIEKRTKKLQELAASTENKPVTIVVQSCVQDEATGKYKLERFVLKDGKVGKLKSPGESKGYGQDVESLLKYAGDTYRCKNLGLILDSHGNGNEGLIGDNGNISMTDLKTHVQKALKQSGHDRLDFLQFDACLMAQNGVLESTQSWARHVVASAEPEGVTADTAAADNKNLAQLLKDPSMTADQLAEWCVARAKDVEGFNTLAHFDMAKYGSFRRSLDELGGKLTSLWNDPEQKAVLQEIISKTFEYGRGSLSNISAAEFHVVSGKDKPGTGTEVHLESKPGLAQILDYLRLRPLFADVPFSELPPLSRSLERPKRDLKDFIEKVAAAVDEGKLKDPDCTLRDSIAKVLADGASLTPSFFGRGAHKGLGGLSVFLPEAGDGTILSASGGWRQFQEMVRAREAKSDRAK